VLADRGEAVEAAGVIYPPPREVSANTTIRWERMIGRPGVVGEVLVRANDRVEVDDTVVRFAQPGREHLISLPRQLGCTLAQALKALRAKEGEVVHQGEVLAQFGSRLIGGVRTVRAPAEGQLTRVFVETGHLLITETDKPVTLTALLKGTVADVIPRRGVIIEAKGGLVQGVWAMGTAATGVLKVVVEAHGEDLSAGAIDVSCLGSVLIGGAGAEAAAIYQAVEAGAVALILGSLPGEVAEAIRLPEDRPFVLMVTEGFGYAPMAEQTFALLRSCAGRQASVRSNLDAKGRFRYPEVAIPLPLASGSPPVTLPRTLKVGTPVRLMRAPFLGLSGTVVALPQLPVTLESGLRTLVAEVELTSDGRHVFIPRSNLELL